MLSAHLVTIAAKCALFISTNAAPCPPTLPEEARDAWVALLHYKPQGGGWTSEVRDKAFFLDSAGVTAPEREWQADFRAFLANDALGEGESAQCRFPARFALMRRILHWPDSVVHECSQVREFERRLSAKSVAVVYVSHYFGSPASAFGHTMLFLSRDSVANADIRLADYAVSFEADTRGMAPTKYLPRGLVGGLVAGYKAEPLYTRVRKYEREELRDIWLFPLNLGEDQIEQLVLHVWELRNLSFRYGFFDENCAEKILTLLNAVAPQSHLTPYRRLAVLPSDVARRSVDYLGLQGPPIFRPSLAVQYQGRVAGLDRIERTQLERMIKTRTVLTGASAQVISAALLWSELKTPYRAFRRGDEVIDHPDHLWVRNLWNARISDSTATGFHISPSATLLQGHRSSSWTLRGGVDNRRAVTDLGARWLLHAVPDPSPGYPPISGVEIGRAAATLRSNGKLRIEELIGLRVENIAARSGVLLQTAWRFDLGARRLSLGNQRPLHWGTEIGFGKSLTVSHNTHSISLYSLAGIRPGLASSDGAIVFRPVGNLDAGTAFDLPGDLRSKISIEYTRGLSGSQPTGYDMTSIVRKGLSPNLDAEALVRLYPTGMHSTLGFVWFR